MVKIKRKKMVVIFFCFGARMVFRVKFLWRTWVNEGESWEVGRRRSIAVETTTSASSAKPVATSRRWSKVGSSVEKVPVDRFPTSPTCSAFLAIHFAPFSFYCPVHEDAPRPLVCLTSSPQYTVQNNDMCFFFKKTNFPLSCNSIIGDLKTKISKGSSKICFQNVFENFIEKMNSFVRKITGNYGKFYSILFLFINLVRKKKNYSTFG